MTIQGVAPIAVPPPKVSTATGVTLHAMQEALGEPLTRLTKSEVGKLVIPTRQELMDNCPIELKEEALNFVDGLGAEFPRVEPARQSFAVLWRQSSDSPFPCPCHCSHRRPQPIAPHCSVGVTG